MNVMQLHVELTNVLKLANTFWQENYQKNRLYLITSLSSKLIDYLENFEITDMIKIEEESYCVYVKNKNDIILIRYGKSNNNFSNDFYFIGEEDQETSFRARFHSNAQEMKIVFDTLFVHIPAIGERVKKIKEHLYWEEFQILQKKNFNGSFLNNHGPKKVIIEGFAIDITKFYEHFKNNRINEELFS
jgi:hypothetical protein